MAQVTVRNEESLDRAIARFKKACNKQGIKREMKKRNYYEKPSTKRRKIALKKQKKLRKKRKKKHK